MGQQPKQLDDWITLGAVQPPQPGGDWETLGGQQQSQWQPNWWIEQGLRTAPAVVGSLVGGLAEGIPSLGVGAIPGAMMGGGAGSAIGNILGNWYAGKEFNPTEFAVETAIGAIPPILGPAKFAGEGIPAIAKYAGKTALRGGLEGAVVSGATTPFQHYAREGDFNAPLEEYEQNAGAGALMGSTMGLGMGAWHGYSLGHSAAAPPPVTPGQRPFDTSVMPGQMQPRELPYWMSRRAPAYAGPEIGPYGLPNPNQGQLDLGMGFPVENPRQQTLQFGEPEYRQQQLLELPPNPYEPISDVEEIQPPFDHPSLDFGRSWRNIGGSDPGLSQTPYIPPINRPPPPPPGPPPFEGQGGFDFGEPPAPPPTPPPPPNSGGGGLGQLSMFDQPIPGLDQTPFARTRTAPSAPVLPTEAIPPSTAAAPPRPTGPAALATMPETVTVTNPATDVPLYRSQGYVSVPGLTGPDNRIIMVRPDVVDKYTAMVTNKEVPPLTSPIGDKRPEIASAINPGDMIADEIIEVPNKKANDPKWVANARNSGYVLLEKGPLTSKFKKAFGTDDEIAFSRVDPNEGDIPARAKVEGGGLYVDTDNRRAAHNVANDYTGPLEGIMGREGAQNALDAADLLGMNGRVHVRITDGQWSADGKPTIEIYDNGAGMDQTTLAEKLARLFSTGKEGDAGATGGKGIGSASYMLGGERFDISTVAVDQHDGIKYEINAGGTPDQFQDPVKGSAWSKKIVHEDTPTGTYIKTIAKQGQLVDHTRDMMDKVIEFSRNRPSTILYDRYGIYNKHDVPIDEMKSWNVESSKEHQFKTHADDKMIGDFKVNNSEIKVLVPTSDPKELRNDTYVQYLNNGMYQYTERRVISVDKIAGVPKNVIVDIHPLVDESHPDYPFVNTREAMKGGIRDEVHDFINKHIRDPALNTRKQKTQELYDSMVHVPVAGRVRNSVIFDPGNRMTPEETVRFGNDPVVQTLLAHYDKMVDQILKATGRQNWIDRVESVGIIFDPESNGIHIPNPTTGQSTILFNIFPRMEQGLDPAANAYRNTLTGLHEAAHVGVESKMLVNLNPAEETDPRAAKFLIDLVNEMAIHGDTLGNTGHGMGFVHRLSEVYTSYGPQRTIADATRLEHILTGGNLGGGYSPEVQDLLHLYQESRGRDATTEDFLSRTGVKQSDQGPAREASVPGSSETDGERASAWQRIKQGTGWGQGGAAAPVRPKGTRKQQEVNYVKEALAIPTNATTTMDISAPGRQGLSMVLTPEFWKAGYKMFKGMSLESFNTMEKDLDRKPIWRRKLNEDGTLSKSFGETIGLKRYQPASKSGPRAEATASRWLETGGSIPFLSPIYRNTLGVPVRASNRMYITFLNQLSTNRAEKLLNAARDMAIEAIDTGSARPGIFRQSFTPEQATNLNPYQNLVLAKEIADFVNTATGQGPLKTHILPFKQTEVSLEAAAGKLGYVLFSPGLLASRVRMLNPSTYIMASPYVRKQYMKAAMGTAAGWAIWSTMIKMGAGDEATVSDDPTSADFGKVRIGNTRMDAGGGFLQFMVAYSRAYKGGYTSSASNEFHRFGEGFQAETQESSAQRFLVNKLNPVAKFAYDVATATQYKPFHVYDRTMQMFIPLFEQDLYELAQKNPDMIPLLGTSAALGGGTQTYEKGESVGKFIAPEDDWLVQGGGGLESLMPWNIGGGQDY